MLIHPSHILLIAQEHADAIQDGTGIYRELQLPDAPLESQRPTTAMRRLLRRRSQLRSDAVGL
jgi:hypothetical protein